MYLLLSNSKFGVLYCIIRHKQPIHLLDQSGQLDQLGLRLRLLQQDQSGRLDLRLRLLQQDQSGRLDLWLRLLQQDQ